METTQINVPLIQYVDYRSNTCSRRQAVTRTNGISMLVLMYKHITDLQTEKHSPRFCTAIKNFMNTFYRSCSLAQPRMRLVVIS